MFHYYKGLTRCYILILLTSCSNTVLKPDHFQNKHDRQFRVVTYNINWGKGDFAVTAPEKTMGTIKYINGDLVLLQEVTPFWHRNLNSHLSGIYPYRVYKGDAYAGGLAVLSKYPITKLEYRKAKEGWHRAIIVTVKSPLGLLQAANLHLTPTLISKTNPKFSLSAFFSTTKIRRKEIEYYYQYLNKNGPVIITGDMNEGNNGFVNQFLNQRGFTDAQLQNNDYSWRWKIGPFNIKRKLDHIFYNQWLLKTQSQIIHDGDSDHYPIAVTFKRL